MSLRIRLVLLILIAALPVLAVQVIDSLRERGAEEEEISRSALRMAELKAERLAGLVELARGVTTAIAHLPSVLERDGEVCAARLRVMLDDLTEFAGAAVFAPDGTSFCRSGGNEPIQVDDRPYFQEVVRERRFVGSGYIVGRARQAPAMVFAGPATDGVGELRAVVVLAFALERLPDVLGAGALPEGTTLKLLDARGNMLARLPPGTGSQSEAPAEILERLRLGPRGTVTANGTDGIRRVYGYVPMPEPARMEAVVGIPLAPALARIDALMWRDLAITGAIFGLAALAALLIGERGIFRPLLAVRAAAGRFARGDLTARVRIGSGAVGEVDALARSLNEMADAIAARETALAASEEFGRRMLASSRDCVQVLDLEGRLLSINPFGQHILEIADQSAVLGRFFPDLWPDLGHAEARNELRDALARVRGGEAARFIGRLCTPSGREMWWDVSLSPIADARGRPERLLVVSRDITELKRAEQQRELLLAELDHRVKNMLAAVQSMARRSLGAGPQADAFVGRVTAMATAHGLLSSSRWEGSALSELLASTLSAQRDRITLEGTEVHLDAQTTQSLALAVHELATNAVRYGALSVAGGRVDLRWTLHQNGGRELRLEWLEYGGPAVARPSVTGFGVPFVKRALEYELRGTVELDFRPEGLRCLMALPLGAPAIDAKHHRSEPGPPRPSATQAAPLAGRRVLVLEDTALVAMEMEAVLADAGYDVVGPAATVAEALLLIEEPGVDAAVLDVNLQGETSFPVAAALRGRGTPFIFVTGYSNRAVFPPELLDAPRLTKPFQQRHLLATLAAAEAPSPPMAEAAS